MDIQLGFFTSAPFHDWPVGTRYEFRGALRWIYLERLYVQVVPRGCDSIVTRGIIENCGRVRQYLLTCFWFAYNVSNVPFVTFVPLVPLVSIEMLPG
jgi:hypothetical protein